MQEQLRLRTQRTHGRSLSEVIAKVNPILRGWYGYFRDSHPSGLRGPDGWLRRRLQALLRKGEKRPGSGLLWSGPPAVAEPGVCGAGASESGPWLMS